MFAVIIVEGEALQVKAIDQWLRDVPTDAPRGNILDKNGKILASTATRYNLYVRPSDTPDKEKVAKLLCDVFGYEYESTLEKISKRTSEVTVATKVNKRAAQRDLCVEFERHLLCRGQFQILSLRRFYDAGFGILLERRFRTNGAGILLRQVSDGSKR